MDTDAAALFILFLWSFVTTAESQPTHRGGVFRIGLLISQGSDRLQLHWAAKTMTESDRQADTQDRRSVTDCKFSLNDNNL